MRGSRYNIKMIKKTEEKQQEALVCGFPSFLFSIFFLSFSFFFINIKSVVCF